MAAATFLRSRTPIAVNAFGRRLYSSLTLPSVASSAAAAPITAQIGKPLLLLRQVASVVVSHRKFSSSVLPQEEKASNKLKQVIDEEINLVVKAEEVMQQAETPEDFPFNIIDKPGDQSITLTREFDREKIEATVFFLQGTEEDLNQDDDDASDDNDDDNLFSSDVHMTVKIDKRQGNIMEFTCNLHDGELEIQDVIIQKSENPSENAYEGPGFKVLDKSLQKALRKYLEVRGIKGSMFDFLRDYMLNKDEKEYLTWLKNMREFLEKSP